VQQRPTFGSAGEMSMKNQWMGVVRRMGMSLRQQGLATTILKVYSLCVDYWFDFRYGVDTCQYSQIDDLTVPGENKARGHGYQPTRLIPLKKILAGIQPMVSADSILVDFGCGKGRVLMIASQYGFREVRGVEFARELYEIAVRNCAVYKSRHETRCEFHVIEGDAACYAIKADENVFFLFNPFDEIVLAAVLHSIETSLQQTDRNVLIIYHNPQYSRLIDEDKWFSLVKEFDYWGCRFTVYSNRQFSRSKAASEPQWSDH
jgi:SAM-dependent methyltransferase